MNPNASLDALFIGIGVLALIPLLIALTHLAYLLFGIGDGTPWSNDRKDWPPNKKGPP